MFLTQQTFNNRIDTLGSAYWNEGRKYRWEYMSAVIDILKIMGAENICEAGASRVPLNDESFLMELDEKALVNKRGAIIDLNISPYRAGIFTKVNNDDVDLGILPDKTFDAFVALQVWEHLENQWQAFSEVQRISRSAILSFPYKWRHGDAAHQGIDEQIISAWTNKVEPVYTKLIRDRIIYVWRF